MDSDQDQKSDEPKQPEELSDLREEEIPSAGFPKKMDFPGTVETDYQSTVKKSGKKKLVLVVILIILVTLSVVFFLMQRKNLSGPEKTPEPTVTPTFSPSPTPKPALLRSDWSFEVLNGSGVTGRAKKVAEGLVALGYSVVKTGNADKDTYAVTQVFVKKDFTDKIDLVIADLRDTIKIASVAGELKDSTASARIILGKD